MNKLRKYTQEDILFIKNNVDKMSYVEIAEKFSDKYGIKFRADSISHVAKRNGIVKSKRIYKEGKNRNFKVQYTDEMLIFLKNNFHSCCGWKEITDLFNLKFNTDMTSCEIRGICKRKFGFVSENPTKFTKKNHPFRLDVGSERVGSGRKICVKVSDDELPSGDTSNWKQKSRVVYENAYGPIPFGGVILHLDGDENNFDLDNLYCVNKKVLACMARENWHKKDKLTTLTAIKCAELMCQLKESEETEC